MVKKIKILDQTYKKGIIYSKEDAIKHINDPNCELTIVKSGKYSDGKEFIVLKIEI